MSISKEELAPNVIQTLLSRLVSDHSPILLDCIRERRSRSLFRFESMWLRVEDFTDRVAGWCSSYMVEGRPFFRLAKKLRLLKKHLKESGIKKCLVGYW